MEGAPGLPPGKKADILYSKTDISRAVRRLASEIVEDSRGAENLVLLGIRVRGDVLADRIAREIQKLEDVEVPVGYLDITMYRDDVGTRNDQPEVHKTDILFSIDDKTVVLVDDVLWTGRTIRAALAAILDLGRSRMIRLAILCDRGGRELPIRPDYVGFEVAARPHELVKVRLKENDGEESVTVLPGKAS